MDEAPAQWQANGDRERDPDDERRLQRRQQNRRYRENHPEQNAATRRKWVDANRDRVREYNRQWRADNLERARELNRESSRRAALRAKKQAALRAKASERAMRWRQSHLDAVRIYQAEWVEQNREKVRGYYNDYYRTHRDEVNERAAARRDADPEPMKRARKAWAERNKERLAELQRNRRSDPEVYQAQLEANAAARRLKRRLRDAGLPPKQLHPATAAERRAHEAAAVIYFRDSNLSEHVRQTDIFTESLTKHILENGPQMRTFAKSYSDIRARVGLPPIYIEDAVYGRAIEFVLDNLASTDLVTSRDIAAAVRSTKALVQRNAREREFERLVKTVVAHVNRHRARLDIEAEIESRARARRGLPLVTVDVLVVRVGLQEVLGRVSTEHLSTADLRSAWRFATTRIISPRELWASPVLSRAAGSRRPVLERSAEKPGAAAAAAGPDRG